MASGVKASPECLSAYQQLKVKDSNGVKLEYIIYKIQFYPAGEGKKPDIVVEKSSTVANYDKFVEDLPESECRWGVFDFEYDSGEGKRKKIVFVMWSPDTASIQNKMVYASSKQSLRDALAGPLVEVQGTDYSEVAKDVVEERVKRR